MQSKYNTVALTTAIVAASLSQASVASDKAEVDFYGSLRLGINSVDAGTSDDGANGRDYLSRVGVKASSKISDDLTAIGRVEYGTRDDNLVDFQQNGSPTLRLMYVGLKGNFGEVYYGSQTLLWHKFVRGAYFSDGNDTVRQGSIRDDDLLQYYYKNGGLTLGASLQFEGQDGDSMDQIQLGAEYKTGPFKFQAAISQDERGDNNGNLIGLRAWWKINKAVTVSAFHHQASDDYDLYGGSSTGNIRLRDSSVEGRKNGINACSSEERTSTGLYGSYRVNAHQVHARYAVDACDVSGDVNSSKVEYVNHLAKNYRVWVSYEMLDNDAARKPTTTSGDDMSELQLGMRFDF